MRASLIGPALVALFASSALAQAGKFPPDSLVNVKVFPKSTPVPQLIAAMRSFTEGLGVRCQFCHVGEEGQPLSQYNFPSDQKRTKLVARQMMLMVEEVNRRVDTIPGHKPDDTRVSCMTCHRGVTIPMPLDQVIANAANAAGADSAIRAYRALRQRYYGSGSYDFGETTLETAALRLGQAGKVDDALALLSLDDEFFPQSSNVAVFRGNVLLMKADTTAAAAAFREAIKRDSTNQQARGRLRAIGRPPHN